MEDDTRIEMLHTIFFLLTVIVRLQVAVYKKKKHEFIFTKLTG